MDLIAVPGGTFTMGSSQAEVERTVAEWQDHLLEDSYRALLRGWLMKEFPAHEARVSPFRMGRFPVRNDEYREYLVDSGARAPESIARGLPADHPVWGVGYDEALAFLRWRSSRDGRRYRLPTEAEWEWAAAGPEGRRYPFGDRFDPSRCNTIESGRLTSSSVDAYPEGASVWGIQDLAGNVEEWTDSVYAPYPGGELVADDLFSLLGPQYRVLRGGSFSLGGDLARTRRRHGPHPGFPFRVTGFRVVVDEEGV